MIGLPIVLNTVLYSRCCVKLTCSSIVPLVIGVQYTARYIRTRLQDDVELIETRSFDPMMRSNSLLCEFGSLLF